MRQPGPPRGLLSATSATAAPALRPGDRLEHERAVPEGAALAEHVAHYWWVAWEVARPMTAETLPHPTVHVVVEGRRAQVVGVPTGVFRRTLPVRGRVFGVKFRPAAFHPWLAGALSKITDRRLPIGDVFGAAGLAYARAIRGAETFAECRVIAEAFFAPRVPALVAETRAIRDLVERMATDVELTRVDQAAALVGLDARTLQRRFAQRVGVSPKWVVQRYRLHEAAAQLAQPAPPTLATLAARLGYFDQAHFARDFKAVVGAPPSAYLARAAI